MTERYVSGYHLWFLSYASVLQTKMAQAFICLTIEIKFDIGYLCVSLWDTSRDFQTHSYQTHS